MCLFNIVSCQGIAIEIKKKKATQGIEYLKTAVVYINDLLFVANTGSAFGEIKWVLIMNDHKQNEETVSELHV